MSDRISSSSAGPGSTSGSPKAIARSATVAPHYGNRAEKLVEFGQQPFRSQPRIRLVGPDGQPVKGGARPAEPSPTPPEPPAPPLKE